MSKSKSLKSDAGRFKGAARYEAIKAKTLKFPSDILQIKSGTPHLKSTDASSPPFFALRFLTTANSHSNSSDLRASKPNKNKVDDEKQLLPVELTINKKIKFPYHKKMSKSGLEGLGSSDGDVIEHLRHQLRPHQHNETMSVLEAMADPEVREERFYYEPLSTFMKDKRNNTAGNKTFQDPYSLRVVNIMIPGVNQSGEDGMMLPFTLSRHLASNTRSTARKSNGQSEVYSFLPRVVGNSLNRKLNGDKSRNLIDYYLSESAQNSHNPTNFILSSNHSKDSPNGMYFPKKSQPNLPHIGHKHYMTEPTDSRDATRTIKNLPSVNNSQRNASTVQLPVHNDGILPRTSAGFPRRATTTATGKSHLIGPMNKMNIIADYSKAMQGGFITYDEYIKKISALSLHKVAMPNSSHRHFQVVRDETNNMKPRLTHVDIDTSQSISTFTKTNETRTTTDNKDNEREESNTTPLGTLKPPRLHKIVIGEGLDLEERNQQSLPSYNEDVTLADIPRYTNAHHGKQPQYFHWSHETKENTPHWRGAYEKEKWFQKNRSVNSNPGKQASDFQSSPRVKVDEMVSEIKPPAVRPIDEYLKLKGVTEQTYSRRKARQFPKSDIPVINENEVSTLPYDHYNLSKLPYQLDEPKDVLTPISHVIPSVVINDQENEEWNAESVFQPHLENMLKTIKKAGAEKRKPKIEAQYIKHAVVPQVFLNRSETSNTNSDKLLGLRKSGGHLNVENAFRVNTPPPPSPTTSEN